MRQIIWIGLALAMLTSCDNRSNMNCEGTICPLDLEENIGRKGRHYLRKCQTFLKEKSERQMQSPKKVSRPLSIKSS